MHGLLENYYIWIIEFFLLSWTIDNHNFFYRKSHWFLRSHGWKKIFESWNFGKSSSWKFHSFKIRSILSAKIKTAKLQFSLTLIDFSSPIFKKAHTWFMNMGNIQRMNHVWDDLQGFSYSLTYFIHKVTQNIEDSPLLI